MQAENNFSQNIISLNPKRIVSLVPSITELLYDAGLDEEVAGITKFCVHPQQWFRTKTRVGGTKNVHYEKVKSLSPDLIIANKEENVKEQVNALQQLAPVWVTDINNYDDGLAMIETCGKITGRENNTAAIISRIKSSFNHLNTGIKQATALYLIWREPYMTIGGDTFIHDMLARAGFINVFGEYVRYPQVSKDMMIKMNPKYVLLSSEPFPFKEKHIQEIKQYLPKATVLLVDGEMFSWYGSRMQYAAAYFEELLSARS